MSIKTYKPITPSLRQRIVIREDDLSNGSSFKKLTIGKRSTGGRNIHGRITVYHKGRGHKRKYRIIDFNRNIGAYSEATILQKEYDPNRSANIALCKTLDNKYFYILAPEGIKVNDKISGKYTENIKILPGNPRKLIELPIGTNIHNIDGKLVKAAGTSAIILKHKLIENTNQYITIIRLPSKQIFEINSNTIATIGRVSNIYHSNRNLGKAGASI